MSGKPHVWYHLVCGEEQFCGSENPLVQTFRRFSEEGKVICVFCLCVADVGVKVEDECPQFQNNRRESSSESQNGSSTSPPSRSETVRSVVRNRHFSNNIQVL